MKELESITLARPLGRICGESIHDSVLEWGCRRYNLRLYAVDGGVFVEGKKGDTERATFLPYGTVIAAEPRAKTAQEWVGDDVAGYRLDLPEAASLDGAPGLAAWLPDKDEPPLCAPQPSPAPEQDAGPPKAPARKKRGRPRKAKP